MNPTRLPKLIYDWEGIEHKGSSWKAYTKKLLISLNLKEYWENQEIKESQEQWNRLIHDKIQEREKNEWRKIMEKKPKLRTYRQIKKNLKLETYISHEDGKGRRMLARLISGTNSLRIETCRYEGRRDYERICKLCANNVEDEEHFLCKCTTYDDIRRDFLDEVSMDENKIDKLLTVMMGDGTQGEIASTIRYVRRASARRNMILKLIN